MKWDINIWFGIFTLLLAASILGVIAAIMKESTNFTIAGVIGTALIAIVWFIIIHRKDANSSK